ncbi:MAG: ferrous iron transport protein B [Desulfobacteraceae bacterium]|nr:ferrous iron transport protein B [Desulfobacteraceae bacterium]
MSLVNIALAGQPNCGKSTLFNALTGASQHVANYPGVTVEKKSGSFRAKDIRFSITDLPGTYSLTSYSLEERVARDFILNEGPEVLINVVDAMTLKRGLYFTFQIMETGRPVVLVLNMMDLAEKNKIKIDHENLAQRLGVEVVPASMKTGSGKKDIIESVYNLSKSEKLKVPSQLDYLDMEEYLREIEVLLSKTSLTSKKIPLRWAAIKLMEDDENAKELVLQEETHQEIIAKVDELRKKFEEEINLKPEMYISKRRFEIAEDIVRTAVKKEENTKSNMTDILDSFLCHKIAGPVLLVGVIYLLYYLAIVQGYNITNYTWPLLAKIRTFTESIMPASGFIEEPLIRAFSLWFVDSVNALLNYIPIFFILFALIAVLEDSGYMPRMAFIMDRLLSRFGLHGQSTLPMVLGGIYVGGCAVPGVMSCRGIPDERSRLATILIIPLLNCLAKVPLYVLLINIYFAAHKGLAMFFISTISILLVLPVSKILTLTILKDKETAPFVMELPPYHIPSVKTVLMRAVERVWLFLKKITTIVAAVAVVIFVLLYYPGISDERMKYYHGEEEKAVSGFLKAASKTSFKEQFNVEKVTELANFYDTYRSAKMQGGSGFENKEKQFEEKFPLYLSIIKPSKDRELKLLGRELKKLVRSRKIISMEMKKERINNSFLGKAGMALEPVTQYAGFNWKVNVALLSALAAKESSVATLGALYQQDESGASLETRMGNEEKGFTPLHALSLMLFMVLYPPCVATAIAVKLMSGSAKFMVFSMIYPMIIGIFVSSAVFSVSTALNLSGLQAMFGFYGLALIFTIIMGFVKNDKNYQN